MVDLPAALDPQGSGLRPRRIFWPGVAAFHEERHLNSPCNVSYVAAMRQIVPRLGLHGYRLVDDIGPRRPQFMTHAGLDVTVIFRPAADGGTNVSAFGQAPRAIRRALATMAD